MVQHHQAPWYSITRTSTMVQHEQDKHHGTAPPGPAPWYSIARTSTVVQHHSTNIFSPTQNLQPKIYCILDVWQECGRYWRWPLTVVRTVWFKTKINVFVTDGEHGKVWSIRPLNYICEEHSKSSAYTFLIFLESWVMWLNTETQLSQLRNPPAAVFCNSVRQLRVTPVNEKLWMSWFFYFVITDGGLNSFHHS